jgi:ribose transport system permease protein
MEHPVPSSSPAPAAAGFHTDWKWRLGASAIWNILLVILIMILAFGWAASIPGGMSGAYARSFTSQVLTILLLIPTTVLLMASGELDLSVGSVAALSAILFFDTVNQGTPLFVAALLALAAAFGLGLVNGILAGPLRIPGVIVTLGMLWLAQGLARLLDVSLAGNIISRENMSGLQLIDPLGWVMAVLLVLVAIALLYFTPFGRRPGLASGHRDSVLERTVYVGVPLAVSGLMAGMSGLVSAEILGFAGVQLGTTLNTDVITAALIGGTAFGTGFGNVFGGALGALAIMLLRHLQLRMELGGGMAMPMVQGGILIAAAVLAHLYRWAVAAVHGGRTGSERPPGEDI